MTHHDPLSTRPDRTLVRISTALHPTPAQAASFAHLEAIAQACQSHMLAWYRQGGLADPSSPLSDPSPRSRVTVPAISIDDLAGICGTFFPGVSPSLVRGVASQVHRATQRYHGRTVPAETLQTGFQHVHVPLDAGIQAAGPDRVWIDGLDTTVVADLWQLPLGLTGALVNAGQAFRHGTERELGTMVRAASDGYRPALSDLDVTLRRYGALLGPQGQAWSGGPAVPARADHATLRRVTRPDRTPGWTVTWSVRIPHGWLPAVHVDDAVGVDVGLRRVLTAASGQDRWMVEGHPAIDLALAFVSVSTSALVRRSVFEKQAAELDEVLKKVLAHTVVGVERTNWTRMSGTVKGRQRVARMMMTGATSVLDWVQALSPVTGSPVVEVSPTGSSCTCSGCDQSGTVTAWQFTCGTCGHSDDADANAALVMRRRALEEAGS
ncbi:zinc ribbon domain-containing protein [Deinococcus enclensis]|uniref:Cas12f1-like TNB domain-containing protein n=1 Tax=Deinococcus enclensis TaxID=1049582 RepID=A0ABT9MI61_9DEIO|nr:zinc ribbon domain-containing protein [Deinococcus enclensis]MDP9766278.1 hypothetical protein [Deinococcus enclensis]